MKFIMFEDAIYGVNQRQLSAIWKIAEKNDELLMINYLRKNVKKYQFIGYILFSFRE